MTSPYGTVGNSSKNYVPVGGSGAGNGGYKPVAGHYKTAHSAYGPAPGNASADSLFAPEGSTYGSVAGGGSETSAEYTSGPVRGDGYAQGYMMRPQ